MAHFAISTQVARGTHIWVSVPFWVLIFVAPLWLALVLITFEIEFGIACCLIFIQVGTYASREISRYLKSRRPTNDG